MGRTTKQLSGSGKDKFLKALLAEHLDVAAAPADQLLERLGTTISDIRVKRDAWEAITHIARSAHSTKRKAKGIGRKPSSALVPDASSDLPLRPLDTAVPLHSVGVASSETSFDPFSFSALAVLTKSGRTTLEAKIAEIHKVEHLIALATAQHLSIDRSLADIDQLRIAIIVATEARLKERRAAAS